MARHVGGKRPYGQALPDCQAESSGADAGIAIGYGSTMSDQQGKTAKDARAERLAAALRANLRKRKGLGDTGDPARSQHPESPKSAD